MSKPDKPHGPVSERFMRHYYGAAKGSTAACNALGALESAAEGWRQCLRSGYADDWATKARATIDAIESLLKKAKA